MTAVLGVLLLASATVLFAWAYGQYRRPVPARWTRLDSVSNAIVLLFVGFLAFGLGLLGRFLLRSGEEPFEALHAGAIAVLVVVAALAVRRLRRRPEPVLTPVSSLATAVPAGPNPGPANDPGNADPRGSGRRARRGKAA